MLVALLYGILGLVAAVPAPAIDEVTPRAGEKCGYDSCVDASSDPEVLNVHIVAHTHDDVGWLKTVDQYYYGSRNDIQKAGVKYILDSVVKELWEDPKRRFIYVETAFFWKWWVAQPASVRSRVHTLVRQGRLQFVGGAWSMNDEATSYYQSTIDQFTWGLRKLNDTFGACGRPAVGWQIDPFGHSREFAAELALMGYDGLFLGRVDYQDKAWRLRDRAMEMLWRGSDDLGKTTDIFTSVLYNTYSPPPEFCFDVLCDDEPIIDDPTSPMFNVEQRVTEFIQYAVEAAKHYRTNNVIVTMGGDFAYQDAFMWFDNLDKLIKYANLKAAKEGLKVKLFYSTPQCYLKAVKDANPTLPIKQDDFFPYASDPTAYWTGYYTSRPNTKFMEREANNYLQSVKMLQVLADLPKSNMATLNELKSAMGVMQHHDAITGTEKQHVAHDYERILSQAVDDALDIAGQAFNKMANSEIKLSHQRCQLNQSQCAVTEDSDTFIVTFFNNQLQPRNDYLNLLPVVEAHYTVHDENGNKVRRSLLPIESQYVNIPTRKSNATHDLFINNGDIPALGFTSYYVERKMSTKQKSDINEANKKFPGDYLRASKKKKEVFPSRNDDEMRMLSDDPMVVEQPRNVVLQKGLATLSIDRSTSRIVYSTTIDGAPVKVVYNWYRYVGCEGNNMSPANRSSGAYILRPNMTASPDYHGFNIVKVTKSSVRQEAVIQYENGASTAISIIDDSKFSLRCVLFVEEGTEGGLSFFTNLNNTNGMFYTDSNGRQSLKRIRNRRPQWNVTLAEPVPGNYYPVASEMYIENDDFRVVVNTDRPKGTSSMTNGNFELMGHRSSKHDDGFGVGEALNETAAGDRLVIVDDLYVQILRKSNKTALREAAELSHFFSAPLHLFVADAKGMTLKQFKKFKTRSFLKTNLPRGANLLTLEPWADGQVLIRFENYLDKSLSPEAISVDLSALFTTIKIKSIRETTLAANKWLSDHKAWDWNTEVEFSRSFNEEYGGGDVERAKQEKEVEDDGLVIKLKAKQIRTFIADYKVIRI